MRVVVRTDRGDLRLRHGDRLRHLHEIEAEAVEVLGAALGDDRLLEPPDRVEQHLRVGGAVAAGELGEEPAPARRFHHRRLDRLVLRLADRRERGPPRHPAPPAPADSDAKVSLRANCDIASPLIWLYEAARHDWRPPAALPAALDERHVDRTERASFGAARRKLRRHRRLPAVLPDLARASRRPSRSPRGDPGASDRGADRRRRAADGARRPRHRPAPAHRRGMLRGRPRLRGAAAGRELRVARRPRGADGARPRPDHPGGRPRHHPGDPARPAPRLRPHPPVGLDRVPGREHRRRLHPRRAAGRCGDLAPPRPCRHRDGDRLARGAGWDGGECRPGRAKARGRSEAPAAQPLVRHRRRRLHPGEPRGALRLRQHPLARPRLLERDHRLALGGRRRRRDPRLRGARQERRPRHRRLRADPRRRRHGRLAFRGARGRSRPARDRSRCRCCTA